MNEDDPTAVMPIVHLVPGRFERWLLVWLAVAYLMAGAVVGFSCVTLASVAHQINATPICRRL